jgi:hypothetical protein
MQQPELSPNDGVETKHDDGGYSFPVGDAGVGGGGGASAGDDGDSDGELGVIAQPLLMRQVSSRTGALQMVGLEMFRDKLIALGLHSLHDFAHIDGGDLVSLGMSPLQRACFDALRAEVVGSSTAPALPSAGAGADSGFLECSVCEEYGPHRRLPCCDTVFCTPCFSRTIVATGKLTTCPSGCGGTVVAETRDAVLRGCCVCCGEELLAGDEDGAAAHVGAVDDIASINCGFNHRVHRRCLAKCVSPRATQQRTTTRQPPPQSHPSGGGAGDVSRTVLSYQHGG